MTTAPSIVSESDPAPAVIGPPDRPASLPELLWHWALRTPDQPMVVSDAGVASYRDVALASGRIATVLAGAGVGRGDRVGILLNKSADALAVLHGAMRLGAAYVPIDPDAPPARAARIVAGSGMRVLVTTTADADRIIGHLPPGSPAPILLLVDGIRSDDRALAWSAVAGATPLDPGHPWPEAEDLAYVLYTSGSTGEPKGVMLTHRAALAFVIWSAELLGLGRDDRVSQVAPWHFDLSTFDLFASALAGATVVLVPKRVMVLPINLARFLEDQAISVWYSVPSALTRLLLHGRLEERQLPSLRHVVFAGEVFPTGYLRQLMAALPGRRFFNWYGPTETNVCTWYEVTTPPEGDAPIPIGRPCAGTIGLAITPEGTVAGPGEEGELYVAGPTVMSGYWGDPAKTAATLGPHDGVPEAVRRGYRTGDWVRPTPGGDFLFTGRRDSMVKSRGFRIELGEIETALYGHPGVEEAVVVAIPDPDLGSSLAAAIVLRPGAAATAADLIKHCAARIPRYMVPQRLQLRDGLPRTLNGKVDRVRIARELDPSSPTAEQGRSP